MWHMSLVIILDDVDPLLEDDPYKVINFKTRLFRDHFATNMVPDCICKLLQMRGIGDQGESVCLRKFDYCSFILITRCY